MIALVFPGQGSQKPGMGRDLAENFPASMGVYQRVSDAVGFDVARLSWFEEEDVLRQTENAQIALFTASMAALEAFRAEGNSRVEAVAGHSVGEFGALVAAGIYSVEDAAKLVHARGQTMAKSGKENPGAMSAVLGLETPQLQEICRETEGDVSVANDNSPGQIVISGTREAVQAAGAAASLAGAKRVIPLNVSGAFHSPLMKASALAMREQFALYQPSDPTLLIYSNVTSEPVKRGADWPDLLERQLVSPVRWTESVRHMVRDGVHTIIECGVGDVLSGLVRRIDKSVTCLKVNDRQSLRETLSALG